LNDALTGLRHLGLFTHAVGAVFAKLLGLARYLHRDELVRFFSARLASSHGDPPEPTILAAVLPEYVRRLKEQQSNQV